VYEKHHIPGGKARSFPKRGTGVAPRNDLPGEHGFRFFPGFYQHLPDTMRRIPFHGQPDGVFGNLVEATRVEIAQDGKKAIISAARFPESLADLECAFRAMRGCAGLGIPAQRSRTSSAACCSSRRARGAGFSEYESRAGGSSSVRPTACAYQRLLAMDSAGRWSLAAPRRSAPARGPHLLQLLRYGDPGCSWTGSNGPRTRLDRPAGRVPPRSRVRYLDTWRRRRPLRHGVTRGRSSSTRRQ
jgi:hypothetical protein